jgi:NAD(P)-dependent dehydrogenase (short-subunit alcohol dehydrogenase family)
MNIIVTGGSNGIGKQIAVNLASDINNNVLITGRDPVTLAAVADSAGKKNINFLVSDFNKLHFAPDVFKSGVASVFNSVDILINNAGILYSEIFEETSGDQAREMMEVNFFVPALIIRILLPMMKKGAHIVNISSMGGFQGSVKFSGLSFYSASKAALACLSECLAVELAERKISVNCLALGSVQTEMLKEAFPGFRAPVTSAEMGMFISDFALNGNRFFNGRIIPVALTTP